MPRSGRLLVCLVATAVASGSAAADTASADRCVKTLSPQALAIYRATAPEVGPATNIPDLLRKKVRPMVMAGKVDRPTARASAEAAGKCLKVLRE